MNSVVQGPSCKPMPAEEYHADKSAWSKGMLLDFRKRRSLCYRRHVLCDAPEKPPSREMDLGELAHAALLEPHRLTREYIAYPQGILASNGAVSTKAAKEFRDAHRAAGHVVLKAEDFDAVAEMVESVQTSIGKWLTSSAMVEHALYWQDEATGLSCKCRPDLLVVTSKHAVILDVKTTGDVNPHEFQRRMESMGYWLQDAHYSAGVRALCHKEPLFLFVVVENAWPFQCAVYELSKHDKAKSYDCHRETLTAVAGCLRSGDWSDSWQGVVNIVNLREWVYSN